MKQIGVSVKLTKTSLTYFLFQTNKKYSTLLKYLDLKYSRLLFITNEFCLAQYIWAVSAYVAHRRQDLNWLGEITEQVGELTTVALIHGHLCTKTTLKLAVISNLNC